MDISSESLHLNHRLAILEDLDDVFELYMNAASNPYLTYDPMDKSQFQEIFHELLLTQTLVVVELDGKVVGTYRLIPKRDRQAHTLYLGGFTVLPALKGKGIGSRILQYVKEAAASLGKSRIELTVDLENFSAIALYKKMGFEIEGRVRNSYKRSSTNRFYDEYLMAVLL